MPNISISEAAARLGRKPWEVQRMIESGVLPAATLVDEASVAKLAEASA